MLGFLTESRAQSFSTRVVGIEIVGKRVVQSYKVFFQTKGKWVEAARTRTGFSIPSEMRTEEYLAILVTVGKYKLIFSEIHNSKFDQDWTIGIDRKPFSDEFVSSEEAETTTNVYYIRFQGMGLGTQLLIKVSKPNSVKH